MVSVRVLLRIRLQVSLSTKQLLPLLILSQCLLQVFLIVSAIPQQIPQRQTAQLSLSFLLKCSTSPRILMQKSSITQSQQFLTALMLFTLNLTGLIWVTAKLKSRVSLRLLKMAHLIPFPLSDISHIRQTGQRKLQKVFTTLFQLFLLSSFPHFSVIHLLQMLLTTFLQRISIPMK